MIVGNIKDVPDNISRYPDKLRQAIEYLASTDFSKLESGRYVLDGETMYANVDRYMTRVPDSGLPEAHRKYIDVQYIVEGEEDISWCPMNSMLREDAPYDENRDIVFFKELVAGNSIVMKKGNYAILFPNDVHRPCGSLYDEPTSVTKVVVKVAVDAI